MAKAARIQIKQLKELQAAMKRGESAIDPEQVKPILFAAVDLIRDEAERILHSGLVKLGGRLPLAGSKHVEEMMTTQNGKSATIATAWTKVLRKFAPQAWWLETGHRLLGHKPNRKDTGLFVGPFPFFRPAVLNKRTEVRRTIRVGLQDLLSKAWGFGKAGDARE